MNRLTYQCCLFAAMALCLCCVLMVSSDLYDPTRSGKWLYLLYTLPVLVVVALPLLVWSRSSAFDVLSALLLLFMGWLLIVGRPGGIWHSEKFLYFSVSFTFFWIVKTALLANTNQSTFNPLWIPVVVIVLLGGTEVILGQLQILDRYPIYHGIYRVTGTFFNPGPYAGFLVACLPYALLVANCPVSTTAWKTLSWLGLLGSLLILAILPATQSRAAWIAAACVLTYFALQYYDLMARLQALYQKRKVLVAALMLGLVVVGGMGSYGLYRFKEDSADGRLLIWKVSKSILLEHPVIGTGFDTFQAHYAPALAAYFAGGSDTPAEQMLAGNVPWAFNEALQLGVELGFPGMLCFLAVVVIALTYPLKTDPSKIQNQIVLAARGSVIGVFSFGLFSYPFHSPAIVLLFFFALAVIAANLKSRRISKGTKLLPVLNPIMALVLVGFSAFGLLQAPKLDEAYWLWDEAKSLYQIKAYEAANESFEEAREVLHTNGLFMQQYGKCLQMAGNYDQALAVLDQSGEFYKDDFWYITLGEVNKALGKAGEAAKCYEQASAMVPHKLYPKYLLALLYEANNQKTEAKILANEILTSEVKVMSTAITEIRQAMQDILSKSMVESGNEERKVSRKTLKPSAPSSPLKGKEVQR
ncbi:O-antigen ligase family protein [Marinoscillum furvescens]|uniref:O-antigen ligase n=1 Tax=Marinoscillum furvescens DSM 4134 TaxID=1122208 RepID=A0A3D9L5A3_MARFU|nr:O-antigen ligase family protein [Marinoscillum furvescens]RED98397.1 O-antigen ligase [Marinoscillum furvescens DSM 4134]